MHIAIEGIDGVGKTTLARSLARQLGFKCVEKHLHALFDSEDFCHIPNYMRITEQVNASDNPTFRAWFYALGNLYLREHYRGMDIVTDRYFASNYSWNGTPENEFIFDKLIEILGKPEITFLIYANPRARMERIRQRNPEDPDLANANQAFSDRIYERLSDFLKRHHFNHYLIDTSDKSIVESIFSMKGILADRFPGRFLNM